MNKLRKYQWAIAAALALALMLTLVGSPVSMAQNRTGATAADILINEFIATPTGSEGVEVCNTTGVDVDLTGWSIDGTAINDGVVVPANGYVVLDDNNTAGISISNAGEVLELVDNNGATIDQVGYGKAGGAPKPEYNYSAARVPDCATTGDDAADWNTDESPTMGAQNDAPTAALGSTTVTINEVESGFIELYNSGDAAVDISDWRLSVDDSYDIPAGSSIPAQGFWVLESSDFPRYFSLDISGDNVYLFNKDKERVDQVGWNAAPTTSGGSWNRVPDGNGSNDGWQQDMTPLTDQAATKGATNVPGSGGGGDTANPGDVLINEFIVTPTSSEAIELCNVTDADIDLSGWVIDWGSGSTTVDNGVTLTGNSYLVLDDNNTGDLSLSNAGAVLSLKDAASTVIDDVGYGKAGGAPKPEYKFSTARVPNCATTGDDAADFNTDETPTMGAANDGPAAALGSSTVTINEVDAKSGEQFIELYNSGDANVDLTGWRLSVDDSYDIPAGASIPAGGFWVLDEADFPRYFNLDEDGDNAYLFNSALERVDQVGWDQAAGSSWNRLPDGAGANNGWKQDQVPLYPLTPSRDGSNQSNLTRMYIHEVQGAQHLSPYVGQHVENVYGIVTVTDSRGFWMQTPDADVDDSDATSEGIYTYVGSGGPGVSKGDEVLVTADVSEYYPGGYGTGNLSITELSHPSVITLSSGNPLPSATILGNGGRIPPNMIIDNDSTGDVNSTPNFDPDQDGIDFYESVEGMLVQINDAQAVGPTSKYGEIPVVGDKGANASVLTVRGGITIRPDDFNPERIIIDDALYSDEPKVTTGDQFSGPIIGVMHYSYGNFKVLNPDPLPPVVSAGLTQEFTKPSYGQLTVATFNVENLDPGDSDAKFQGLATIIASNMRAPDIIGVEEVQDNNGPSDDGTVDASATFQKLIAAIQAAGGPTYDFRQINPLNDEDGGQPGGNIRVGFLFRPDRVTFVDHPGGDATTPTDVQLTANGPELTLSPGRVDPNNPAFSGDAALGYEASRKSLAGEFIFQGYKVFVIVNHFKSKGGDDHLFGRVQPPVQNTLPQRKAQAQAINAFAQKILDVDPNANIVVVGDLNDFDFSDTLMALKGDILPNLVEHLPRQDRYSFIYNGNSQQLDHALSSKNMADNFFTRIDVVHVNSEFPGERASDHDPVIAAFDLPVWRFDGYAYQGQPGDESMPKAGVTVRLYGRNAGEAAPGNWYKDVTTDASGYFNFHIIKPFDFDTFTLMSMPPAGMAASGAWSEDGTVIAPDAIEWNQAEPGAHRNKFWFDVPTPTPTPTPTPSMIWLPVFLNN